MRLLAINNYYNIIVNQKLVLNYFYFYFIYCSLNKNVETRQHIKSNLNYRHLWTKNEPKYGSLTSY